MADNVTFQTTTLATASNGTVIAADDISGAAYQRFKLTLGADGTNDGDVSSSNPVPVAGTVLGSVTETAPATDTASSGLNGRLQRIAQRLTSLIALLPASLGQKVKAASLPVVIASDQDTLVVSASGTFTTKETRASTCTVTSVNDSNTNQTLLSSNSNRLGYSVYNDSTEILYLKNGTTATSTDFTISIAPKGYWECPFHYTGRVDGIWAANASGAAKISEYT